jgi:hypothetical protein
MLTYADVCANVLRHAAHELELEKRRGAGQTEELLIKLAQADEQARCRHTAFQG